MAFFYKKVITLFALLCFITSNALWAKTKVYKLNLAATWGATLHPLIDVPKNMAKMAKVMSNGQLVIRVDAANKHKAPLGVFDMVKAGKYDMAHSTSYFWKGKDINLLLFTTMPFGMTTAEQYAWFYYGGGLELMQRAYKKHKMLSFPGGNTGNQMGGWFRKEIKSVADLKGLKMRIPGFAGEVMAKLGVSATNIAPGELYTSLERGTIDALEWVSPYLDLAMGFHKITPYYYTGWHEPGAEAQFMINQRSFNKLPNHLQNILVHSMRLAAYDLYVQLYALNATAWQKMKTDYPEIKIKTFPKSVMQAMKQANKQLLQQIAQGKPLFQEILKSQQAFQQKARAWTKISDYLYLKDNL